MDIEMYREQLSPTLISEMMPLLKAHRDELCVYDDFELDPQWDSYYQLQGAGGLRVFTARFESELIGYAAYAVHQNLHYSARRHAVQDVLFLRADFRGKMAGYMFIKFIDEMLQQEGVHVVSQHVKVHMDWGRLLERVGYQQVEKIYEKRLN